jgi:hypothetical protein
MSTTNFASLTASLVIAVVAPTFSATALASEATTSALCEPHQVTTELLGVRRTAPGQIAVDVGYQHTSNFAYKLNAAGGVALIDSNGEKWETSDKGNNLSKVGDMVAGVRYKHTYRFFKRVGGNDVTAVTFTHRFRVWQGGKLLGTCTFEAKGIALK